MDSWVYWIFIDLMITSKNTSSQIPKHDPKPWKTHSTIFDLWLTTEFLTLLTLWTTPTFPSHPFPWAADTTSTATSAKDVTPKRFRARSFSECGFPGGSSRALCWAGMMFPGKVYQLISIDNKVCHLYMFGIFCSTTLSKSKIMGGLINSYCFPIVMVMSLISWGLY